MRLFTGNQITTSGLGFSGNEAEEVFASENDRNTNKRTIFIITHYVISCGKSYKFICVPSITLLLMLRMGRP